MLSKILNPPIRESAIELIETLRSGLVRFRPTGTDEHYDEAQIPSLGLRRSARLPIVSVLHSELHRPILLITDKTDRALTLMDELGLIAPDLPRYFFPEPNPLFYEDAPWGETTKRERLSLLTILAAHHVPVGKNIRQNVVIIAPARAVMTRTLPLRQFLKAMLTIREGQALSPEVLIRRLVEIGFEAVNTVIAAGQFARRGGIIDIWSPSEQSPLRLEYFGDEIASLRIFDPSTQRSTSRVDQFMISPAREFLLSEESRYPTNIDLEHPSEFLIPLLHPEPACILNYLPSGSLVLIDNLEDLRSTIEEIEEQAVKMRSDLIAEGSLPENFPVPYLTWLEIQDILTSQQTIELGPSSTPENSHLAQRFTSAPRFGGRLKPLLAHLEDRYRAGDQVVIVSRQASRLAELWMEQRPPLLQKSAQPEFIEGSLTEGWILTPPKGRVLHLLTDGEIFSWRRPEIRRRQRIATESPEAPYTDLQVGDWVVHIDHGVGRFLGLVNRIVDGIEREYLVIEYAEGDQLFVPVHQADRLTRYIGPDSKIPTQTRLGGSEWRATKARVKEAVEEVAEDLLNLYVQRQIATGFAFSPDTAWQHDLEASFPYIETEDQVRVIEEVKKDMESSRPMDRLICGDVGYGKTEVALRAAFKAVMDGKQVAMLVPTTVLAQQHYNTFRERLAAFPVEVEMLSRFRTPQQQRDILLRLAMGTIDIIIGTHRLLQNDVQFKDLGLLIIDEEQRFGVTHKEHLKKLRTEVDVLTLTATPIPRTLYLALTGVRDISTINTPPEERLPVITHVGPYSTRLVRQAILRELERGGQVFFVHNRVQTIEAFRNHLERLVPEARIAVAHGQMDEEELSRRMEQFNAGEIDVLLSTSIIESGLDIPNANTLIVDRADTFGLSQLYQLRGRVGRGAQRAYAYFFKHRRKNPTAEGRQRLETVAENTQLGAGFSIAMRDLEIRGAGDILGTRQHGHIAAVGFHLYTRLLNQAVINLRKSRGLPPPPGQSELEVQKPLVNVDLPIHLGIPADYIPDKTMRLRLYRRIADLRSLAEVDALTEEFTDRFGLPPSPVRNLLYQLKIKLLAQICEISSVSNENGQIVIRFQNGFPPEELPRSFPEFRIGKTAIWMAYRTLPDWKDRLLAYLEELSRIQGGIG